MTCIASLLSIPPLSKVQVLSRRTIVDASINTVGRIDLPFWYFQCVVGEQLELRSPGGYVARVDFHEVCDVVPAESLIVMAMPRQRMLRRIALPIAERQLAPTPDLFEPAQVMWLTKDRWNRVDSVYVRFLDDQHNVGESPIAAPVDDQSRTMLNRTARRDRMPVSAEKSGANLCALSRQPADRLRGARAVERFMREALTSSPQAPIAD